MPTLINDVKLLFYEAESTADLRGAPLFVIHETEVGRAVLMMTISTVAMSSSSSTAVLCLLARLCVRHIDDDSASLFEQALDHALQSVPRLLKIGTLSSRIINKKET